AQQMRESLADVIGRSSADQKNRWPGSTWTSKSRTAKEFLYLSSADAKQFEGREPGLGLLRYFRRSVQQAAFDLFRLWQRQQSRKLTHCGKAPSSVACAYRSDAAKLRENALGIFVIN